MSYAFIIIENFFKDVFTSSKTFFSHKITSKASPDCKKEKPGTYSSSDPESDARFLPAPGPVRFHPSFWAPQPVGLVVTEICLCHILLETVVDACWPVAPLVDVKGC